MPLRRNRLVAWIAAGAVLLQALWPLIAHARPGERSVVVPICSIDGVTHYLEIKIGKTPLEQRSASHGEHCKLCVFGGDKFAIVFAPDAVVLLSGASLIGPRTGSIPPAFSAQRSPSHPRAPPVQP